LQLGGATLYKVRSLDPGQSPGGALGAKHSAEERVHSSITLADQLLIEALENFDFAETDVQYDQRRSGNTDNMFIMKLITQHHFCFMLYLITKFSYQQKLFLNTCFIT
jgi:hypothetical protein